jgi:hypothetical protein
MYGNMRHVHKISLGKAKCKTSVGKSRRRRMTLKIGFEVVDWIQLALNRIQ